MASSRTVRQVKQGERLRRHQNAYGNTSASGIISSQTYVQNICETIIRFTFSQKSV